MRTRKGEKSGKHRLIKEETPRSTQFVMLITIYYFIFPVQFYVSTSF